MELVLFSTLFFSFTQVETKASADDGWSTVAGKKGKGRGGKGGGGGGSSAHHRRPAQRRGKGGSGPYRTPAQRGGRGGSGGRNSHQEKKSEGCPTQ